MFLNGLGAFVTGITVIVVLFAKFVEGAWITLLLVPALILIDAHRAAALPPGGRGHRSGRADPGT